MVIACIIAAFSLGVLFALALPAWFLVVMQSVLIIALVAIVVVLAGVIFATSINTLTNDTNNTTNDTVNVTLNDTNDTNNTTVNTKEASSSKKSSKSDSNIASESIKENYQAGDGSHYREVQYKDGNIRQYDSSGKLIGSSYDSDQAQLKRDAGDSWPGD